MTHRNKMSVATMDVTCRSSHCGRWSRSQIKSLQTFFICLKIVNESEKIESVYLVRSVMSFWYWEKIWSLFHLNKRVYSIFDLSQNQDNEK